MNDPHTTHGIPQILIVQGLHEEVTDKVNELLRNGWDIQNIESHYAVNVVSFPPQAVNVIYYAAVMVKSE